MPLARLRFALALLLLAGAAPARGQPGPEAWDEKAVDAWVQARVRNAKAGTREIVRIPIVRRSTGWGCMCPWHYLGNNVGSYGGKSWLALTTAPGVSLSDRRDGWVQIAEGTFTGATATEDYSKHCDGCKDWIYTLYQFHVERARPAPKESESLRVHVLLAGKEASEKVAPLADGKPWLVMVSSVARGDKNSAAQAAAQRDKLVKAGFAGAAVIDSRSAPLLSCCYHVVVAGRFATQAEATALAKDVKKKKLPASVKKGF
ncbi:MAG: SPOR domain-containing protein [Deltaproteobacteria bacterium]|nr:SPOR domain-containing protein [Deltaproteobacteria bacterium]